MSTLSDNHHHSNRHSSTSVTGKQRRRRRKQTTNLDHSEPQQQHLPITTTTTSDVTTSQQQRRLQRRQRRLRRQPKGLWSLPLRLYRHVYQTYGGPVALVGSILVVGLTLFVLLSLAVWTYKHAQCYSREAGVVWHEGPSHSMHRPCPPVDYDTLLSQDDNNSSQPHICLVTLTDEQSPSGWQRLARCRNFDQVGRATWPIRLAYANQHGYTLVDYSASIDPSRPPAWSKIKAVQSLMPTTMTTTTNDVEDQHHKDDKASSLAHAKPCDWIFWMDADTVITNASVKVESFLPLPDSGIDMLVTWDRRFTANSGAWLVRANSAFARTFLSKWWNLRGWVRPAGYSLSGDNAAFGHLMDQVLLANDDGDSSNHHQERDHVRMVPRCTFNSFGVYLTETQAAELEQHTELVAQQEWHQQSDRYFYHGDFIGHASGIDQKEVGVQMLLKRAVTT